MSTRKPVILYIDDDADYRLAMRQLLEANGYDVVEAQTGEDGLRVFRDAKPDLVIVDLMMEEIDSGVNFLRQARTTGRKVPIYLLSSVGDTLASTAHAADLGFTGVLQKPFSSEWLLNMIRSQLA